MSRMYRGGPPQRGGPPGMQSKMAGGPLQKARLALMNGQPALAVEVCRRELEKKDDVNTRLLLAQALVQMQRAKEAVIEARRVVEAQPKNVDALMLLSSALIQTNQVNPPKEALEIAERAVQLQPKTARTHVQLAEVLISQQQFDRAKEEADVAVQLEPRTAVGYLLRSMALIELKDYEAALHDSQNAIRYDNTMAGGYVGKARALTELKRTDEAMTAIDEAERMNPMLPPAQMIQLRAQVYAKQRKYGKAYRIWLDFANRTNRSAMAPVAAFIQLMTTIFGRYGIFVVIAIAALILFGIAEIPFVGGWLFDAVIVGLGGVGAWNLLRTFTGKTVPQLFRNPVTALLGVGTVIVAFVLVFGVAAAIVGRGGHSLRFTDWFTPLTLGLGSLLALVGGTAVVRFAPGSTSV